MFFLNFTSFTGFHTEFLSLTGRKFEDFMYVCGNIKRMKGIYLTIVSIALLLLMGCKGKPTDEKIVSVTIEPQRYFAEKIAGNKYKINCVVPVGQSPESYDPTPLQMIEVGESAAYLRIGPIGFEQAWMDNIKKNNPHLTVFDLSEGMNLLNSTEEDEAEHAHAHHHHHHAGSVDPHIWSSISGARVIARNTLNAFITLDKANEAYYRANYDQLVEEIDRTEQIIREQLDPLENRTFIIYHPALTYFAHDFDLTQLCIEMDGKEPSPAQLKNLVETARANGTRIVFIQQEFDKKNAELIARETGCQLVQINPLDVAWNKEMIHIANALAHGQTD